MRRFEKAAKLINSAVDALVLLICLVLVLLGAYSAADNMWVYASSKDGSLLAYRPELKEALAEEKRISSDQIGWINVPGTGIDFPVLQGSGNTEYLNRDPYGEFSYSGSIFLDYRCSAELSDDYSVIYGHHMSGGHMFGCLDDYRDPKFLEAHREGSFSSRSGSFDLEIFAAFECLATDPEIFRPGGCGMEKVRGFIREKTGAEPEPSQRLLALTTCTADGGDTRLAVLAYIRPTEVED